MDHSEILKALQYAEKALFEVDQAMPWPTNEHFKNNHITIRLSREAVDRFRTSFYRLQEILLEVDHG